MRVSVAMCTYNGSLFLREQLSSIVKQSLMPDELVICDDGSTDATAQIVSNFVRTAPLEVHFIQNSSRLGSTRNFEKALSLCRGRLIALADQDDVWYPEKLAALAGNLEANPDLGGIFSDAELIDENSRQIGHRLWKRKHFSPQAEALSADEMIAVLLKENVATGATMMIRRDLLDMLLPMDPLWIHDGWITWMLVLYSKLGFVRTPLTFYRVHDSQQVGADSRSLGETIANGRRAGGTPFVNFARQFEVLCDRWCAIPGSNFVERRLLLEGKIRHMYLRAQLSRNRATRGLQILRSANDYSRYSRGVASMVRDLVL
jgi:glycosyltransferase involved in cell wall biosynthesis